jgi:hypothetical protein
MNQHPMEIVQVPVGDLSPHPDNANESDMRALVDSIKVNGFYTPIIASANTGYVLAGNHRLRAAIEMGSETIPTIFLDVNDEEAKRIMLADNRTTRLGHDDPIALAELLDSLFDTDLALAGTGYSTQDLNELMSSIENPYVPETLVPSDLPSNSPGGGIQWHIIAQSEPDGDCRELIVSREDGRPISVSDFNRVRIAIGLDTASRSDIIDQDIPDWNS